LALSSEPFNFDSGHTVLAMVTSADNPAWPMDVQIDASSAGLRSASKVRMKLFTLDNRLILRKAGSLSSSDQRAVKAVVKGLLGTQTPLNFSTLRGPRGTPSVSGQASIAADAAAAHSAGPRTKLDRI